jgi:hypothetical protein
MSPATVLDFVNLFFAGILAGIEIVIHYGLRAPRFWANSRRSSSVKHWY